MRPNQPLTINAAIERGLAEIENCVWRRHQTNSANAGIKRFLKEKYPRLKFWKELQTRHIYEFNNWIVREMKFKSGTANNYRNVIRKASAYMQIYHPEQWSQLFIKSMKRQRDMRPERFLEADQLAKAAQVARDMNEPSVVFAFAFGGLAGLGIAEILSLKSEDVTEDTIRVTREKNVFRARVIPICEPLKPYAVAFKQLFKQFPIKGHFVLSQKARRVLDRCAEITGDVTYKQVSLHDATRVTFANMASQAGAELEFLQAYLGHAGRSILDTHYLKLIPRHDDLPRVLKAKTNQLDERVLTALNMKLEGVLFL